MENIDIYLSGRALYGDDFTPDQIAEWFADEKEGYADLGARVTQSYAYGYHAWNIFHGYRHLPTGRITQVLGFGSAYGDELMPIISMVDGVTIVDPSDAFTGRSLGGVPVTYVKPTPEGRLPLHEDTYDLITCFGVLHHIPNVSFVAQELARILKPGGHLLLREPIVSMGDWRFPRRGLTRRERGIPLHILKATIQRCRLGVVRQGLCDFPLTSRLFRAVRTDVYNSNMATRCDAMLSSAFAWNINYHPRNALQRIRPRSVFMLLRKAAVDCA